MTTTRANINAKRLADPEYNTRYLAKRRAQKARARARKKTQKTPRTHCKNGHPRTPENLAGRGQCRECRKATRIAARAVMPPVPPKMSKTSVQRRAADPVGYREHERQLEAQRLGRPVLTREEHLAQLAEKRLTPEERTARHKAAMKAVYQKKKAARLPKVKKAFCKNGHPRTPENLKGRQCILCNQAGAKAPTKKFARKMQSIAARGAGYKVYGLVDPRGPEIFYIGCTVDPKGRLENHLREVRMGEARERLAELKALNLVPSLVLLEHTMDSMREQAWIEFFRPYGIVNSEKTRLYQHSSVKRSLHVLRMQNGPEPAVEE